MRIGGYKSVTFKEVRLKPLTKTRPPSRVFYYLSFGVVGAPQLARRRPKDGPTYPPRRRQPPPLPAMSGLFLLAYEVPMSTEQQMQQGLAELPTWLLILVATAGLVGEMRQADVAGVTLVVIIKRVLLRFGSSAGFGMAALMLAWWAWHDVYLAGGLAIGVGLLGADIAGALYARWLAKRAGICEVPAASTDQQGA